MGTLHYGSAPAITIEDRLLKHLQAVIVAKLRRHENFAFNWDEEPGVGGVQPDAARHGSVWIAEATPLYFAYEGTRNGSLNRAWLEELMRCASSNNGLRALPESEVPRPDAGSETAPQAVL